ncbi:hypothetical protein M378DRAFT_171271, partial [Amanita muscaria Koide BX008]
SSTSKADAFSCLEQLVLVPDLEMPQDWVAYHTCQTHLTKISLRALSFSHKDGG